MLDALEISRVLMEGQFSDVQTALAHYETEMRQRGAEMAAVSIESMEQLHSPGGLAWMARVGE